ncbi:hypothetical protein B296_00035870 [Ensete ventricosum]|uniref:XRRM domain-containing protein n=1 Tax=Ensete ventricosum TaxID=4639 RepID=A0A426XG37_ENSVE|nr:hypothetical protein B296_00035870 [Ensete ventricosum]
MKSHLGLSAAMKPEDIPEETVLSVADVLRTSPSLRVSEDGKFLSIWLCVIVAFKLKKKQEDKCVEHNGADKVNDDAGLCKAKECLNKTSEESEQLAVAVGESTDGVDKENESKAAEDVPKEREEEITDDVAKDMENKDDKGPSTDSVEVKNPVPDNKSDNDGIVTREDLKQIFQKFGAVKVFCDLDHNGPPTFVLIDFYFIFLKYVDYRMGEESGYIRFEDPDAATKARAMAVLVDEGGLTVKNCIVTLEALTGESEKEYWNLLRSNQERHRGR